MSGQVGGALPHAGGQACQVRSAQRGDLRRRRPYQRHAQQIGLKLQQQIVAGRAAVAPPAGYTVQVSADGRTWSAPVAQGVGQNPKTTIAFAPIAAKFVRITQTGTPANPQAGWAIARLTVFRAGSTGN